MVFITNSVITRLLRWFDCKKHGRIVTVFSVDDANEAGNDMMSLSKWTPEVAYVCH